MFKIFNLFLVFVKILNLFFFKLVSRCVLLNYVVKWIGENFFLIVLNLFCWWVVVEFVFWFFLFECNLMRWFIMFFCWCFIVKCNVY